MAPPRPGRDAGGLTAASWRRARLLGLDAAGEVGDGGAEEEVLHLQPHLQHLPDLAQHADRHQRLSAEAEEIVVDADRLAGGASVGAENLREDARDDLFGRGPRGDERRPLGGDTGRVDQAQRRGQRDPLLLPG